MRPPRYTYVYPTLRTFEYLKQSLWLSWHGTGAHLNGMLHKISLCVYMCIALSLLGTGSVKALPRQRIHTQQ
jgi:hypothetical protein